MDKMKKFGKYLMWVVLFYIFSTIMINAFLRVTFVDIKDYKVEFNKPYVEITEAKASPRNGHIYGIIKNNTDEKIENKYLKVSMLSRSKVVLGEKYIQINKLDVKELKRFEVSFEYDNVKSFKIEMVETKPEEADFFELVKINAKDLIDKSAEKFNEVIE